jgi:PAS domain S-box-containing protein
VLVRAKGAVLEAILSGATDAVLAYDRELRYVYVSPSAARILGAAPEELLGRQPDELHPPALARPWKALAQRVLATGQPVREEAVHRGPTGERTYQYTMTPVRDDRGQVELVVNVVRDVTDERRGRSELAAASAAAERARERASKLHDVAAALSRANTDLEVATAVVNEGIAALDAEAAVAYMVDANGRNVLRAARGLPEQILVNRAVLPDDAPLPLADALRTGEPVWIQSLDELLLRYPNVRTAATPVSKLQAVVAVPLRINERTIGGVAFSFGAQRIFDSDERRFLLTVVSHAAVAAERCRLRTEERAARKRLTILAGASRRFSEARLELSATLDTVAREIAVQLGESCAINLLSSDGQVLEPVAVANVDPEAEEATRRTMTAAPVRLDEGSALARTVASGQSLFIPRVPDDFAAQRARPEYRDHHRRFPVSSLMVVPLSARGVALGTITAGRGPVGPPYTREDLALLEDLAARAGLAVADARQHAELEAERRRLDVLARASELLATSLDYDQTLHNVIHLALPTLGDFGFFDVREPDGGVRRVALAHQDPERQRLLDQTRWAPWERRDKILCALSAGVLGFHPRIDADWLTDVADSPEHLAEMDRLEFASMITVPLAYHGVLLGALTLFFVRGGRQHTEADLRLAEELARRAAAAVENARLLKASREAVAVRDDFLSIAGHELNTPLAALQLQIESLKRQAEKEPMSPRFRERLAKTEGHALRIERLVRELLDVSRITGGRLSIEREPMDLVAVVRDTIERLGPQAAHAGCVIRLSGPEAIEGSWDRLRIEQVVSNLIGNSIKYGRGKPIEVALAADDDRAIITVRDFGIGISPEDEARIFGRFERAVSQRHYGGLGLGLWIARQIVEAHGGSIQFERPPDVGTLFAVALPR